MSGDYWDRFPDRYQQRLPPPNHKDTKNLYKKTSEKLKISIDELKEYQKQLIFSERMRSLGELAAGLAHEIKNPLSSIKSSVEVIEGTVNKDSPVREFLGILSKETSSRTRRVQEDSLVEL